MRILIIADPLLPVPPNGYGGTERIVAMQAKVLSQAGYKVRLLAGSGSKDFGDGVFTHVRPSNAYSSRLRRKLQFQAQALWASRNIDVVINHGRVDYLHSLMAGRLPLVTWFHNPVAQAEIDFLNRYRTRRRCLVFVSRNQCSTLERLKEHRVVPNSVDTDFFRPAEGRSDSRYLLFLGRLTANKGVHIAIAAARKAGLHLKIAGNVSDEPRAREYFASQVRPELGRGCEWVGEVNDEQKRGLLQGAAALLFPIQWPEPFGLVQAESLACGTPVVALRAGASPEVVRTGTNGFLCESEDEMVGGIRRIGEIDRLTCRRDAEKRFSPANLLAGTLDAIECARLSRSP